MMPARTYFATWTLSLCLAAPLPAWSQASVPSKQEALQKVALEPLQGAWDAGQQRSVADQWNAIRQENPKDAEAQYNYFKAARNASLATNNASMPARDEAELDQVARTLSENAPNSFESCMANYQLDHPARQAFTELGKAYQLEPDRQELIGPMLGRALLDNDRPEIVRWSRALRTRGGLAPGLHDAAADLLVSIDPKGVVFTNGDMDTHPAVASQEVDGLRKDVLVVDQRLLVDAAYRQHVWTEARASGQVPGPGPEYARTLSTRTDRPVFLALSIDPTWIMALQGQLYPTGLAMRVSTRPVDNIPALAQRWPLLRKPVNAGPLSRNYLLPGSVLLQHYRAVEDEAGIARTEAELRRFSDRIGATQELYKAGILKH